MDVSAPARPISHQRPTQAYYVPRRLLENGRGPQPTTTNAAESEKESREPVMKPVTVPASKSLNKETTTNRGNKTDKSVNNNITPSNNNNTVKQSNISKKPNISKDQQQGADNRRKPKVSPLRDESSKENRQKSKNLATAAVATNKTQQTSITSKQPATRPNAFCPQVLEAGKTQCICKRPESHIICKRCGYEGFGRVQVVCIQHPMKLNLMDLRECPEALCRSILIVELQTSNISNS
ncbi:unnamed protein product [Auanema sp. JU1783]|nr:unnamed protein product [Auanema sp. JU1783]